MADASPQRRRQHRSDSPGRDTAPARAQWIGVVLLLVWIVVPATWVPAGTLRLREVLRDDGPNRADVEARERGYYEALLETGRSLAILDSAVEPSADPPFQAGPLADEVADIREYVLKPNLTFGVPGGQWSTNAERMRDRSYPVAKAGDIRRIALIGDSIAAGWGVADTDGFEPRWEVALDAESRRRGGPGIEVLNFAVPGQAPGQRWATFDAFGWNYKIDLVVYEASPADLGWDERRLRRLLTLGLGWDAPQYREALARAGIRPGDSPERYRSQLKPLRWAILEGVYRNIVAECRSRDVPAVWILIPRLGKKSDPEERRELLDLARRCGFDPVWDLSDVFDGREPHALAIAPNDYHPNAEGHALLANRLTALALNPDPSPLATLLRPAPRDDAVRTVDYTSDDPPRAGSPLP